MFASTTGIHGTKPSPYFLPTSASNPGFWLTCPTLVQVILSSARLTCSREAAASLSPTVFSVMSFLGAPRLLR